MARNIGIMAQKTLEFWAGQASITTNPATIDYEGWDYLLQFPVSQSDPVSPLDLRPPRIECLVQVKGLGTPRTRERVKLSIWEKLAKSFLPTFFLVVQFGQEDQPQNAYLVHVGEEWIAKVLRRLRETPLDQANLLNKKYLYLTWGEADQLTTLNGEGLAHAIRQHIGNSMESYLKRKAEILETAGEPTSTLIYFTTVHKSIEEMWTELVDLAIGLRDEIVTSNVAVEEQIRFGIPAKRTQYSVEGTLKIVERPATEVTLTFRNETGTWRAVFAGRLYIPNFLFAGEPVPQPHMKVRALFEIGEIVFSVATRRASLRFNFRQAREFRTLHDHANVWRMVNILQAAETAGFVLEIEHFDGAFRLEEAELPQPGEEVRKIARAVENAWFLARYFDISPDVELALEQILQQENALEELRRICDVNYPITSIGGGIDDASIPAGKDFAVAFLRRLAFGSTLVVVGVGLTGPIIFDESGNGHIFRIDNPRRILNQYYPGTNFEEASYAQLLDELSDRLEKKGYEVIKIVDWAVT